MHGQWIQHPQQNKIVIFVHGILCLVPKLRFTTIKLN